jgi:hypothetical protein
MFDRITWSNIELESVRLCDGDRVNIMLINIATSRIELQTFRRYGFAMAME